MHHEIEKASHVFFSQLAKNDSIMGPSIEKTSAICGVKHTSKFQRICNVFSFPQIYITAIGKFALHLINGLVSKSNLHYLFSSYI